MPEVSVIIPSRNAAAWLPRAIASAAHPGAEVVVVDDGSTDETAALLSRMSRAMPALRVLQGGGGGVALARNIGLAAARAPLIAFLDADDAWRPGKLDAQLALHRMRPELGFSFTDYRHVTEAGEDRGPCFAFWPRFAAMMRDQAAPLVLTRPLDQLLAENVVGTSTVVARADLLDRLGGFDPLIGASEDWDMWLRLARVAPVGCVPGILADYTLHRVGNLSGARGARVEAMRRVITRHAPLAAPWARRAAGARLLVARAEAAQGEWAAPLALRCAAALLQPSWRMWREAAAALRPVQPVRP